MKKRIFLPFLLVFILLFTSAAYAQDLKTDKANEKQIIIFHAGSLKVSLEKMAKAFEARNPGTKIVLEGGGSVDMARKITEQKRPCDILAVADYDVIDTMFKPEHTKFNIFFATNQMALLYSDKSKFANEINSNNWYQILAKPNVVYGHSDPNLDPGGYRALFVMQLAEKYYKVPGLYEKLSKSPQCKIIGTKSEIANGLKSGTLDYVLVYQSTAKDFGVKYVSLPDQINLSAFKLAKLYSQTSLEIKGKEAGTFREVKGTPIIYGVTLLDNAPNKELAKKFLHFMLTDGAKITKEAGLQPFIPAEVTDIDSASIPLELKKDVKKI